MAALRDAAPQLPGPMRAASRHVLDEIDFHAAGASDCHGQPSAAIVKAPSLIARSVGSA